MQKQAKITSIQGDGVWESDYGKFYKYEIAFENGDSGQYLSKNYASVDLLPFQTLDEIHYLYDASKPEFPRIKSPSKEAPKDGQSFSGNQGGFKSKGSNASFALSYAKDLGISMIAQGQQVGSAEVMLVADAFKKWLDDNA